MSNFYVYLHTKADTLEPFYVGKGKGNRAYKPYSRNKYWQSIVKKHGFIAEILATWKTEQEAFDHERLLISCFKDMGYKLANMTEGGEGSSGFVPTKEMRQKMSIAQKGKRLGDDNPMRKGDTANRVADKIRSVKRPERSGENNPSKRPEVREKMSLAKKGKNLGKLNNSYDPTEYLWEHKLHGKLQTTKHYMKTIFHIGNSCVCAIVAGRQKSAKGWVCLGKA